MIQSSLERLKTHYLQKKLKIYSTKADSKSEAGVTFDNSFFENYFDFV